MAVGGESELRDTRCLEIGTYCGYSTLLIARNLPEGSTLLSGTRCAPTLSPNASSYLCPPLHSLFSCFLAMAPMRDT